MRLNEDLFQRSTATRHHPSTDRKSDRLTWTHTAPMGSTGWSQRDTLTTGHGHCRDNRRQATDEIGAVITAVRAAIHPELPVHASASRPAGCAATARTCRPPTPWRGATTPAAPHACPTAPRTPQLRQLPDLRPAVARAGPRPSRHPLRTVRGSGVTAAATCSHHWRHCTCGPRIRWCRPRHHIRSAACAPVGRTARRSRRSGTRGAARRPVLWARIEARCKPDLQRAAPRPGVLTKPRRTQRAALHDVTGSTGLHPQAAVLVDDITTVVLRSHRPARSSTTECRSSKPASDPGAAPVRELHLSSA